MSIEAEIKALTAAVTENTATLKALGAAALKGGAGTASGTKPATTKPKGPTQKDIADKFGEYVNVTDKAVRKERIAMLTKVNSHFNVAKITDATPEQWVEALEILEKLNAGEDPFDDDDGAGEALV